MSRALPFFFCSSLNSSEQQTFTFTLFWLFFCFFCFFFSFWSFFDSAVHVFRAQYIYIVRLRCIEISRSSLDVGLIMIQRTTREEEKFGRGFVCCALLLSIPFIFFICFVDIHQVVVVVLVVEWSDSGV